MLGCCTELPTRRPMANSRTMRIRAGTLTIEAELNESETASLIWRALPIEATAQTWGEEIYFSIPVSAPEEKNARAVVDVGTIAYWPPGNAFCIFFGPTPASRNRNEIRPYSPVNVVGTVSGDSTTFRQVRSGTPIRLENAGVPA
jgi:uncharacterized protein